MPSPAAPHSLIRLVHPHTTECRNVDPTSSFYRGIFHDDPLHYFYLLRRAVSSPLDWQCEGVWPHRGGSEPEGGMVKGCVRCLAAGARRSADSPYRFHATGRDSRGCDSSGQRSGGSRRSQRNAACCSGCVGSSAAAVSECGRLRARMRWLAPDSMHLQVHANAPSSAAATLEQAGQLCNSVITTT